MRIRYGSKRQARILVVDDERTIALTLSAILQKQGYAVATAFSGEEAVARAAEFFPDLLVYDVCLGAMNGVEAATWITVMLPECGVLFLSGQASMADVMNAAPERLVYSFASKPLHPLDLLNAIAYMLSAVSTPDDAAAMAAVPGAIQRNGIEWMPGKAGFILKDVKTGAVAANQGKPDSVLFEIRFAGTAGRAMQLQ